MHTIHKFRLAITDEQTIKVPEGATVLRVAAQPEVDMNALFVWAYVDTNQPLVDRTFVIVGTGHDAPPIGAWVGSCDHGPFVWHVFQR